MSELVNVSIAQQRDIRTVTSEIITIQRQAQQMMLGYSIEVGRRLTEAKSMVPFGEWGNYLREELNFSTSTANNLMRIFEEYGDAQITIFGAVSNSQALGNLSYTKALQLLAIPAEEREAFAEEHDIEHKSTREIDRLIKERDAALAAQKAAEDQLAEAELDLASAEKAQEAARTAKAEAEAARTKLAAAEEKAQKAKDREKKAKEDLQRALDNPQVSPEALAKIKAEAEQAAKEAAEVDLKERTADLIRKAQEAQEAASKAAAKQAAVEKELETAKKQAAIAAPEVTTFKLHFEALQRDFEALMESFDKVKASNPETAVNLQAAISAVIEQFCGRVGG